MGLLAAVTYDPASRTDKAGTALLAMTALDTTNLRVTFTAPASGNVLVRMRTLYRGSASPMYLLGVLDGSTVRGRLAPSANKAGATATQRHILEAEFLVTGLTPGNSYTWDAAYAVQVVVASSGQISYGGPDDASSDTATGAFCFEVWDAPHLLAGTLYDPATAVSKDLGTLSAMTAIDTTNLRLSFTTPASGPGSSYVLVRMHAGVSGAASSATQADVMLGVLDGSTVKGRVTVPVLQHQVGTALATDIKAIEGAFIVPVSPNTSYTWDAAWSVDAILASDNIKYGGPNDASGNDAWGGFAYEIWKAG